MLGLTFEIYNCMMIVLYLCAKDDKCQFIVNIILRIVIIIILILPRPIGLGYMAQNYGLTNKSKNTYPPKSYARYTSGA